MKVLLLCFLSAVASSLALAQSKNGPIDQVTSKYFLAQLIKDHVYIFISPSTATSIVTHRVEPKLPEGPGMARVSGTVGIAFEIAKDGTIHHPMVVSGPKLLKASVLAAVRQWTFEPVRIGDSPVMVATSIQLNVSNF